MYPNVIFALPFPNVAKLSSLSKNWIKVTIWTVSKLFGALWQWGRKRKVGLQLCLWNLNICIEKVDGMLIGRDDITNDIIILGMCFSMFVYIHDHFHFALIGGNLTAQSTGNHRWIGGRMNSNSRGQRSWLWLVASSPSFSHPAARAPRRACSQACHHMVGCESG